MLRKSQKTLGDTFFAAHCTLCASELNYVVYDYDAPFYRGVLYFGELLMKLSHLHLVSDEVNEEPVKRCGHRLNHFTA